ncbi:hypothetical protein [Mesorhizobium sp.]|uniref:hypothetical protein n=1 Tax=Mesorhizobium sp. TaxID=1871066 RepID=UPI00122447BA|nr:hypothetical protein [Mesorhizobium sp.]TIO36543.1 MAG: hypothetical protein E5X89_00570 [Mesorhizobium sp.]
MSTALATAALAASLDDEHPDAHLFRLDQEMAEAEAQMDRAEKACRRAGKKAEKAERLLPPRPADWTEPSMPAGIREIMAGLQVRDLASPEKHPAPLRAWNKARDEQRAAHRALQEAYLDKVAEVNRETGADDADDAYSARADEFFNVVDRILATPASTLQGIAIKIRASEKTDCSFAARNGAFRSIAADIKRLAGEARDG